MEAAEVIKWFVDTEIKKTECMQRHFKQLCPRCKEYVGCSLYLERFSAWEALQREAKNG